MSRGKFSDYHLQVDGQVITLTIELPLNLPSLPNTRMVWKALMGLKQRQKRAVDRAMRGKTVPPLPMVVTITRTGPRKLDEDNLQGACKYVRDAVAEAVGLDDGHSLYTWVYRQSIGPYSVIIELTHQPLPKVVTRDPFTS